MKSAEQHDDSRLVKVSSEQARAAEVFAKVPTYWATLNTPSSEQARAAEVFAKGVFSRVLASWVQDLLVIRGYNQDLLAVSDNNLETSTSCDPSIQSKRVA